MTQTRAKEFQIKAAILKELTTFIDWPKDSDIYKPAKPFIIGIYGNTPLGDEIKAFYLDSKEYLKDKKVEIQLVSEKDEIPHCHLLLISPAAKYRLSKIIAALKDRPILTIGDTEGFADRGVHINLIIRQKKVVFEVNQKAVKDSGLNASHHLLKAALRVIKADNKDKMVEMQ